MLSIQWGQFIDDFKVYSRVDQCIIVYGVYIFVLLVGVDLGF